MADTVIKVLDKGPLLVTGPVEVVDAEGNKFETKAQFGLCRCGQSKNRPFCDGMHQKAGFDDCARAKKVL
ncbi:MAG TPA: CDGSH iron-sulfur domain-containing protein [Symbiobacteriaceae bacterium]|jgi:CDGSH-type Zn-finger protein